MTIHSRLIRLPSRGRLRCVLALATGALLLGHPPPAAAATFTVTKTSDSKDGACNSDCSLREAIIAAHQLAGTDTITLPAGIYRVTLSDLDITSNLSIVGAGATTTIIDGNAQDRIFEIRSGIIATIDKVTIRNGLLSEATGYTWDIAHGGGILNAGTLALTNSTVSGNVVPDGQGAGIANTGALTLTNSTVSGNSGQVPLGTGILNDGTLTLTNSTISSNRNDAGPGGGIYNWGKATISNSTINDNSAGEGGGINNNGTMTITNSTVSGNQANTDGGGIGNTWGSLTIIGSTVNGNRAASNGSPGGGGIWNYDGTVSLVNSTVSGNSAKGGGGIYNLLGTTTVSNSTIAGNQATSNGGGVYSYYGGGDGTTLSNTIIAGNVTGSSPSDCGGQLISAGHNLIQNRSDCAILGNTSGNRIGLDSQLGPLQNNGGPTLTHLPASGSPALDAGNPYAPGSRENTCAMTDQRGQTRPKDGNGDGTARCDIGAVERSGARRDAQY